MSYKFNNGKLFHSEDCNLKQNWDAAWKNIKSMPEGVDKDIATMELLEIIDTCTCGAKKEYEEAIKPAKEFMIKEGLISQETEEVQIHVDKTRFNTEVHRLSELLTAFYHSEIDRRLK